MQSKRTYKNAIECLNTLQSRASILNALEKTGPLNFSDGLSLSINNFHTIGYEPKDYDKLNVIHVAGTKGKGSTCAFVESIIRNYPLKNKRIRTGLYTSPHLVSVRERIRMDGKQISEEKFTKYFFDCWDKFYNTTTTVNDHMDDNFPNYYRLVTLVAFHAFVEEQVDVVILEVGIGGEYDTTNVVKSPIVCGITSLGYDHQLLLGETINEIAWHKAGIFKKKVPALTVEQPKKAYEVLKQRAAEKEVIYSIDSKNSFHIRLNGRHQKINAALAIELCRVWFQTCHSNLNIGGLSSDKVPQEFLIGLEKTRLSGRGQIIKIPTMDQLTFYCDGAHTVESIQCCMDWFRETAFQDYSSKIPMYFKNYYVPQSRDNANQENSAAPTNVKRILLFNCTGKRSGLDLLKVITASPYIQFDYAVFCANVVYSDNHSEPDSKGPALSTISLTNQESFKNDWLSLIAQQETNNNILEQRAHLFPSIEHAINWIKEYVVRGTENNTHVQVLVSGSLHLVGGVLEVLGVDVE
ncbi:8593_t:CDS:10 [Ambispora gerdemannii]|uniref:Folylpolyglutamate synthase n=1 Tax=Ambispora gerdemannii TaxID=144530 RepID=A0A9N8V8V4_9GLOM|nr:8593_t:CDS:10 [Ambispora gerdemannii]